MTQHTCILCHIYRPDADPRTPVRPPVCEGDRYRLSREIADIRRLHNRLVNPDPVEVDNRRYDAQYQLWDATAKEWVEHNEQRRRDPLAAIGGVAAIPSRSNQPSVTGSRERATPVNLDTVDLANDARRPNATAAARQHPDDQIGHLSVATVLDSWVRDLRDTLWPGLHLPPATVPELVAWLLVGVSDTSPGARIDDACDRHPAIDEMAIELHELRRTLRGALGESEPQPERIEGVACRGCDLRTLFRQPGDYYRAECGACGLLYTEAEYVEWVGELAADERGKRSTEEVQRVLQRA